LISAPVGALRVGPWAPYSAPMFR